MKDFFNKITFWIWSFFNHTYLLGEFNNGINGKLRLNFDDFLELVKNQYLFKQDSSSHIPNEMPCYYFVDCGKSLIFIGSYDLDNKKFACVTTGDANNKKYLSMTMIRTIVVSAEKQGNRAIKFGRMSEFVKKSNKGITMGELL